MKIKICGITRVEDALCCIEERVDFIGLNFYPPSPRSIEATQAALLTERIKGELGGTKLVGVFVNETFQMISSIVRQCDLDAVQLHGDEGPELIKKLHDSGIPTYKAFRGVPKVDNLDGFVKIQDELLPNLLIDAFHPGLYGGTGKVIEAGDLMIIDDQLDQLLDPSINARYLLAGGLKPDNVAEVISLAKPWGVDTASGVESAPGVKDPRLIERFCNAARNLNA